MVLMRNLLIKPVIFKNISVKVKRQLNNMDKVMDIVNLNKLNF